MKPEKFRAILFVIILCTYILVGLRVIQVLISVTPRYDFNIYENALAKTLAGVNPYDVREIGPAFIYPPPSLFLIEIFDLLINPPLRKVVFLIVNVLILILIIHRIATRFGYSLKQVWFWFPLGFFFAPYFAAVQVGQINLITEVGILIFFLSTSPLFAALGIVLATITKITPIAFLGYSFIRKETKTIVYAVIFLILIFAASILHYGLKVHLTYIDVFTQLLSNFPVAQSSQSFVSKIWGTFWSLLAHVNPSLFQRMYMLYLAILVLCSGVLATKTRDTIPLFIVLGFAITVSPNIMWYHHYVFLLLPLYLWMAWQKLDQQLILWVMLGMLIIQIDYYFLTTGLIIHFFVQISLIRILYQQYSQIRDVISIRDVSPVG